MKRKSDTVPKQTARPTFATAPTDPPLLSSLNFAEQFLVWSLRLWSRQGQPGPIELQMLRDAWRLARAEALFADFDSCMTMITVTATPPLQTGQLHDLTPTLDEARLLAIFRAYQQGDTEQAKKALCTRFPCAAVRICGSALDTFAHRLASTGHRLPDRLWPLVEWDELGQLTLESDRISANSMH